MRLTVSTLSQVRLVTHVLSRALVKVSGEMLIRNESKWHATVTTYEIFRYVFSHP